MSSPASTSGTTSGEEKVFVKVTSDVFEAPLLRRVLPTTPFSQIRRIIDNPTGTLMYQGVPLNLDSTPAAYGMKTGQKNAVRLEFLAIKTAEVAATSTAAAVPPADGHASAASTDRDGGSATRPPLPVSRPPADRSADAPVAPGPAAPPPTVPAADAPSTGGGTAGQPSRPATSAWMAAPSRSSTGSRPADYDDESSTQTRPPAPSSVTASTLLPTAASRPPVAPSVVDPTPTRPPAPTTSSSSSALQGPGRPQALSSGSQPRRSAPRDDLGSDELRVAGPSSTPGTRPADPGAHTQYHRRADSRSGSVSEQQLSMASGAWQQQQQQLPMSPYYHSSGGHPPASSTATTAGGSMVISPPQYQRHQQQQQQQQQQFSSSLSAAGPGSTSYQSSSSYQQQPQQQQLQLQLQGDVGSAQQQHYSAATAHHHYSPGHPPPPPVVPYHPPPPPPAVSLSAFAAAQDDIMRLQEDVAMLRDALASERVRRDCLEVQVGQLAATVRAQAAVIQSQQLVVTEDAATREHKRLMDSLKEQRRLHAALQASMSSGGTGAGGGGATPMMMSSGHDISSGGGASRFTTPQSSALTSLAALRANGL